MDLAFEEIKNENKSLAKDLGSLICMKQPRKRAHKGSHDRVDMRRAIDHSDYVWKRINAKTGRDHWSIKFNFCRMLKQNS